MNINIKKLKYKYQMLITKEILFYIAKFCNISTLLSLSLSSKNVYKNIMNNDYFWKTKLLFDYPDCGDLVHLENNMIEDKLTYKKIYKSLHCNTIQWYCTVLNPNLIPPKIYDTVTRNPLIPENSSNWYKAERENLSFSIYGNFPRDKNIWLAYCEGDSSNSLNNFSKAFLSEDAAINFLLDAFKNRVSQDYLSIAHRSKFIENLNITPEKYFDCELSEIPIKFKKMLHENNYISYPNSNEPEYHDYYIIKNLKLCSFRKNS